MSEVALMKERGNNMSMFHHMKIFENIKNIKTYTKEGPRLIDQQIRLLAKKKPLLWVGGFLALGYIVGRLTKRR